MNLEDHIGDIIRKARAMSNITPAAAASAAGISEAELSRLEKSGVIEKKINFGALAPLIGLNAGKLERIAGGWLPKPQDPTNWRELRMFTTASDDATVNNYLVWDEVQRDAAVFDSGFDAQPVLDVIAKEGLVLRHIFITHSHYDHVQALPKLREAWPKARVHSGSKNAPVEQRNKTAEITHLGGLRITHRDTPGHAEDGVTYIIGNWQEDSPHVAVVGDTIFSGSMGTGNQSWELARQKVRDEILTLPATTLICPGHGPLTTVAEEKENNPFF
jgi:glyoxylase-like metal-dependent hydrolase (beta-lactamase superfamily II)